MKKHPIHFFHFHHQKPSFLGKNYYVYDETDLHENRTSVLPFTGSLRVTCDNNQKIDIQLPNFVTDNKQIIELHQGDLLSDTDKRATLMS